MLQEFVRVNVYSGKQCELRMMSQDVISERVTTRECNQWTIRQHVDQF